MRSLRHYFFYLRFSLHVLIPLLSMPPVPQWYVGRAAIRGVFARVWHDLEFRVVPTAANRQPSSRATSADRPPGLAPSRE